MPRTSRTLAGAAALVIPLALAGPVTAGDPTTTPTAESKNSPTRSAMDQPIGTVTLVTGDEVTIGAPVRGKQPSVLVDPVDERGSGFTVHRGHGEVSVVPDDVSALVPDVLDPALFDVTGLLEMGYGDDERRSLPLIVHRAPGVSKLGSRSPLTATATLPSIDATATELPKSSAAEFGDALAAVPSTRAGAAADALGGASRIWLDGQVEATALDPYLEKVEASAAWDSGLDGSGVDLAVLDTGVDAGHPALDGVIDSEQNFTDGDSTADGNGHGTHVTSLIAGNGAGSDGARQGIARAAGVLSGKVLDDEGNGQESWVIAGMEWAAEQNADIVSMSLGGRPTEGDDPVAQSLDRLTDETGTLFVVAAGNRGGLGRYPGTIDTPGSAASALTVAATKTTSDGAAGFSGQGPTLGTYRLKPDVAAPGVDILGARAGARDGDLYVPISGTSQATPIVAGAAALLAQQHPDWTPGQLKARIVTTADHGDFPTSWKLGGGRLNLRRATDETLTSDTAALDFGYVRHPEESVAEREVTLHNPGPADLTVTATDEELDEDGKLASGGAVTVEPATLTVPAGGSATTTVTFDPELVADGTWQGGIAFATGDTTLLRLPFGAYDEPERYDLQVRVLDRNGDPYQPAAAETHPMAEPSVSLFNADNGFSDVVPLNADGEGSARVTPGHYGIVARIATPTANGKASFTFAGTTETEVFQDVDYVVDARNGKRLRPPKIAGQGTTVEQSTMMASRHSEAGPGLTELGFFDPPDIEQGRIFVEPNSYPQTGRYDTDLQWRLEPTGPTRPSAPDAYELDLTDRRLPDTTGTKLTARDVSRLARVDSDFRAIERPTEAYQQRVYANGNTGIGIQHEWPIDVPTGEVDLRSAGDGVQWKDCVDLAPDRMRALCDTMHFYDRGSRATSDFADGLHATPFGGTARTATGFRIEMSLGDGAHRGKLPGSSIDDSRVVLRNGRGRVLGRADATFGYFEVRPDVRTLRLTHEWTLSPEWIDTSSRTQWTFHSAPPKDPTVASSTVPPLLRVDYGPRVDGRGRARAGRPLPLDVSFDHLDASDATRRIARTRLWWSSNDGKRWHSIAAKRTAVDTFAATVPARAMLAGERLSLRVDAADAESNTIRQRAIGVVPVR